MIRIFLGNVGSGKTASVVRDMYRNPSKYQTYSNIITKGIKSNSMITPEMIVKKDIVAYKNKKDGSTEPVYETKLNIDFWKSKEDPINVILDEAHSIINSRRSMSKANIIVTDWLALIRRVLGSATSGSGDLTLITQLPNRIDSIARDMATHIRYHRCHFTKTCRKCKLSWKESSDHPEQVWCCKRCGSNNINKHSHIIEVWHFANMDLFTRWDEFRIRSFHKHYFINDIETIFPKYNTLQWDNMFSELY